MSHVFEAHEGESFDPWQPRAGIFAQQLGVREELDAHFLEGTRVGATPVTSGSRAPHAHARDPAPASGHRPFEVQASRSSARRSGMRRSRPAVRGDLLPRERPGSPHPASLRARRASGRVEQEAFMDRWLAAKDEQRLRELLLREDQYMVVRLDGRERWVDRPIRPLSCPTTCSSSRSSEPTISCPPRGVPFWRGAMADDDRTPASIDRVRRVFES